MYTWPEKIESPALIEKDGNYFIFGSHLTGWKTNDNVYSTAKSLAGPWSEWRTFAEPGSETYHSQTSFVLQVRDMFIYMGDRWDPDNLMRSSYIWLPLKVHGSTATMRDRRNWILDSRGQWNEGNTGAIYEAEDTDLFGTAKKVPCRNCTSGYMVSGLDSKNSGLILSHTQPGRAGDATILIRFANPDGQQYYGGIRVNNGAVQPVAYLPSCSTTVCHVYDHSVTAVHVTLKAGTNDIKLLGSSGSSPGIDQIEILTT